MLKTVLTAGFAMFSMFFGSGNLVFPLMLGTQTLQHATSSLSGFFITAVIVPFLGLISMIAFNGDRERFFSTLGRGTGFILTFLILALIGPFAVIPRCITVAYGGLQLIWPTLSFPWFSALFCLLTAGLIWRPNKVVGIIGILLTPFKLGGIGLLVVCGVLFAPPIQEGTMATFQAFTLGLSTGYQTMDLMAAFFFSSAIVQYLREKLTASGQEGTAPSQSLLMKCSLSASLIGAILLTLIYAGFIHLGAAYAPHLHEAQPESLLAAIGGLTLGSHALSIVSITLAVSCLATAVILATLFMSFLKEDIAEKRLNVRLSNGMSIAITIGITFVIAQLGFSKICSLLGTVLEVAYPALIALACHHIMTFWCKKINYSKFLFWGILGLSLFLSF